MNGSEIIELLSFTSFFLVDRIDAGSDISSGLHTASFAGARSMYTQGKSGVEGPQSQGTELAAPSHPEQHRKYTRGKYFTVVS